MAYNGVKPRPAEDRFWEKVIVVPGSCWPWMGAQQSKGYGTLGLTNGSAVYAHRFAYELLVGPIPDGLQIDHLCRNRCCVNPDHMEPVTQKENLARGEINGNKTHCPQGHPYAGDNVRFRPNGHRYCRECNNARARERKRKVAA